MPRIARLPRIPGIPTMSGIPGAAPGADMPRSARRKTPKNTVSAASDAQKTSPLVLADRLLTLAQDADRAGMARPAAKLLKLAWAVWDEKPMAYLAG